MKKTLIGGFLTLSGSTASAILTASAAMTPVNSWVTPPGRFVCTILESGTAIPLLFSLVLLAAGLLILGREYFQKPSVSAVLNSENEKDV